MQIFFLIWLGQLVSLLGSNLTEFALGVWAYQTTGSITQFALISLFIHLPNIIISPIAGTFVDRWNRRWAMILSDSVAGASTLVVMALVFSGRLDIWHIYLVVAISSTFKAFQLPAYTAATTQLMPQEHLSRANGMMQASRATAKILGPTLAGVLLETIHLQGILLIDFITFIFALVTLLRVQIPHLQSSHHTHQKQAHFSQLRQDLVSGWRYIAKRQGLRGLLMFFAVVYFSMGILQVLFWPLVLSFASSAELGVILSIGGCGMLIGSLVMATWGGPKPRIYGIFSFVILQGLFLLLGGCRASVSLAALGAFGVLFAQPIIVSCNQTIWQNKVPANLQGRVFALQLAIENSLLILAHMLTGPLVDHVLEPMMATDGLLAGSIGHIIGVGPGRGMGLLLLLMGLLNILASFIAYRYPPIRRVEKELPDAIHPNLGLTSSSSV
ncbi:MFS transporter [Moorena producens JHB]|uniref:MFS transporter n=1 Tax=Moorena producens (strain JHB) TaxID=1454205 RepID=A0A1D9G7E6_MOOP1|nr:MFS transporter [Moorena producens]AOY83567.1 MFS transporter [Moorena producens JHB]